MRLLKIVKQMSRPQLAAVTCSGLLVVAAGGFTAIGAPEWGMLSLAMLNMLLLLVIVQLSRRVTKLNQPKSTGLETRLDRVEARIDTTHRRLLGTIESERHEAAVRHREMLAALKNSRDAN
ncbi:hypothetical protein FB566_3597 [Stackebrandtia endophytica]|uniref:Uncharacterized protein n=1 Tax=Stackebrandtia endophytica TaxID=1496996 RepID=A0A543AZL2_9ACTN|nr:hypothetical protein [Stackebrandtia endophytica]TQL78022.1 hypothetical protein FB566_3597 [Stackebrandtia endophytica]